MDGLIVDSLNDWTEAELSGFADSLHRFAACLDRSVYHVPD